jgi:hypothetical protein
MIRQWIKSVKMILTQVGEHGERGIIAIKKICKKIFCGCKIKINDPWIADEVSVIVKDHEMIKKRPGVNQQGIYQHRIYRPCRHDQGGGLQIAVTGQFRIS